MELPVKFLERMKSLEDFDAFLDSYNENPKSGIRINKRKENAFGLLKNVLPDAKRVPWCDRGFYVNKDTLGGNHPYHMAGMVYFQEPSAMCAAEMLPLEKGDLVLDLCAAPGGKTTQIAENEDIVLVSNEIIPKRSSVLSENVERMGFENVIVLNENPENLEDKYRETFDKIIIDAPCSGEGMFKKEPAAVQAWSEEHVLSCAERQKKIIDSAMKMLKPGGAVVYSTCTFSEEENMGAVNYITENYPDMKLEKAEVLYPHRVEGEGHFAALLSHSEEKCERDVKGREYTCFREAVKLFKEFEKKHLKTDLNGYFISFGDNLYLMPVFLPIDGVKVKRAGLHLGECRKGRFEPAHALAKYLRKEDFINYINLTADDENVKKYLRGETIEGQFSGYGCVLCDGLPLGWAKGVNGILKNHFPKALRLY